MHADAVVVISDGSEQAGYADVIVLTEGVQGQGAVFAAAPAEEDRGG